MADTTPTSGYSVNWNGITDNHADVASGVYMIVFEALKKSGNVHREATKVIVLK